MVSVASIDGDSDMLKRPLREAVRRKVRAETREIVSEGFTR